MSESFEQNLQVMGARWPDLLTRLLAEDSESLSVELVEGLGSTLSVGGIQLTSRHDRVAEARLQAASLPPDSPLLHVYGTGLGDLQQVLLERPTLKRLCVHVLNGALFKLVLGLLDQQSWLTDPRVELSYAADHPEILLPFFALPAELVLADDDNARIRDRLVGGVHLTFNNREFDRQVAVIVQRLQDTGEQPERPLFISVATAYRPLREQGIRPDIVVSIDQRIGFRHLPPEASDDIPLVYMPMSDPQVLQAWKGPRYGGYSISPIYASVREQRQRGLLFVGGSVLHPAVDLAVKMGATRITLFGADFAFPMNKTHAGWKDGDLGPGVDLAQHWVLDGQGQRVRTQLNFRRYLVELERYIARHPQVAFLNSSRAGAQIVGTGFDQEFVQ